MTITNQDIIDQMDRVIAREDEFTAERRYWELLAELKKVEERTGYLLIDQGVNQQDAECVWWDDNDKKTVRYWEAMRSSAINTAQYLALNEYDEDINDLVGYGLYTAA
tara:strand:+ start:563 stop:886 length:324 start_codon:yes stop_codon:yes gene_type:complete